MPNPGPKIGDLLFGGRYELLQQVQGSIGNPRCFLGQKGLCRYCGTQEPSLFQKLAHTFPEALGNKWVFSNDECDNCNTKIFSLYDEELTKSVSPFLTLGGVKGKNNKTRQTGRTSGKSTIVHDRNEGGRRLFFALNELPSARPKDNIMLDASGKKMQMDFPIAPVPFKPRHAYKAIVKMALALLPQDELAHYQKLRAWLLDVNDREDFPVLEVGMSFASIGNAPALVGGQLLRRTDPQDVIPYILFLFTAGSVCLQIDLMSDHKEDHLPFVPQGTIKIECNNIIGDGNGAQHVFQYGPPVHLNWASRQTEAQPIEKMEFNFDMTTNRGYFTPVFRTHPSR